MRERGVSSEPDVMKVAKQTILIISIKAKWRIYASVNYTIIGSDNDLSPGRQRPLTWTNEVLLSIRP